MNVSKFFLDENPNDVMYELYDDTFVIMNIDESKCPSKFLVVCQNLYDYRDTWGKDLIDNRLTTLWGLNKFRRHGV